LHISDRITRAWRQWVQRNVGPDWLDRDIADAIENDDGESVALFLLLQIDDGNVIVEDVKGPQSTDAVPEPEDGTMLVVEIPVFEGITKEDLLDFDLVRASRWWEHPDWDAEGGEATLP